jgi:hypothetical protein
MRYIKSAQYLIECNDHQIQQKLTLAIKRSLSVGDLRHTQIYVEQST